MFLEWLDVINAEPVVDYPAIGDNTLDLLLTNSVSLDIKCCDIPGLGDHQTAILADRECQSKKQKSISRKSIIIDKSIISLIEEQILCFPSCTNLRACRPI